MSSDPNAITADPAGEQMPRQAVAPTLEPVPTEPESLPGAPHVEGYRIIAKLGQGGMGTVWRAVQLSTRRQVALKLLAVGPGSSKKKARFEREVELAAKIEHPNLARVYDSGQEAGWYYYAMELIEGEHLDTYVARQRLGKRPIIELMGTVCRAIQAAHQRGVIHRDLKPSNILVSGDGQPHVVDFGLAKTMLDDFSQVPISIDGDVAGTPAYMSPEQAAGRVSQIDTRSDVYSLGVILYQLLTGSTPHDTSGTSYQVMKRIIEQDPRTPRSISKTIDRELQALLMKTLRREPDRRYASAGEMAADIENYLRGDPLTAKKVTVRYLLMKRIRKHRVLVSSITTILLIAAALAIYQYLRPADVTFDTTPTGATVMVDGEKQGCCTPVTLSLGRGSHKIEIIPKDEEKGDYAPVVRSIDVSWGRARGQPSEPTVLSPLFQTLVFTSEPPGATVEIRARDSSTTLFETTAGWLKLPRGIYRARMVLDGYVDPESEVLIEIRGSAEPLPISRQLVRR